MSRHDRQTARRFLSLVTLACVLLCSPLAVAGTDQALAWTVGDQVAERWTVTKVIVHMEFVRIELSAGDQRTLVEVVADTQPSGEWTTGQHRIQPAPKATPDETLLRVMLDTLRTWEKTVATKQGHDGKKRTSHLRIRTAGEAPLLRSFDGASLALTALNNVTLVMLLVLFALALRRRRELWPSVLVVVTTIAAASWYLLVDQSASDLPLEWLTVLHEGPTSQTVEFLHGHNRHTGPNHDLLVWLTSAGAEFGLRDIIRLNLWLSCVDAALLLLASRLVLGNLVGAVAITAVFVACPANLYAAWSELAAPASNLYLLLGVLAVASTLDEQASRRRQWLGLTGLVLLTALMGLTRTETAGFGLVALCVVGGRVLLGREGMEALAKRMMARAKTSSWPWRVGVLLALAATLPAMWLDGGVTGRLGWLIAGLHPLNPSFLSAPVLLWTLLPIAAVVLVVLGFVHGFRRWQQVALLPISVLILYRVYFCASHRVYYEMVRYSAALLPAFALTACYGWHELCHIAARHGWHRRWRTVALAIIAGLLIVPPIETGASFFWDHRPGALPSSGPLDTDQQVEARQLLGAVERHPRCVLITRTTDETERVDAPRSYNYILFGQPLPAPIRKEAATVSLQHLVDEDLAEVQCVLFFQGMDCHLVDANDCQDVVAGKPRIEGVMRRSRPYNDAFEYGETRDQLDIALYRLR